MWTGLDFVIVQRDPTFRGLRPENHIPRPAGHQDTKNLGKGYPICFLDESDSQPVTQAQAIPGKFILPAWSLTQPAVG